MAKKRKQKNYTKEEYRSLFELNGKGIVAWLTDLKDVVNLDPNDIFKAYKPLDRGNKKLNANILSFSLPSISTCGMHCEGCYDIRAMRYISARKKRYVNYSMAVHNPEKLKALIIKQIKNSRTVEFIRLHVGGEFYDIKYVKMWKEIAEEIKLIKPDVEFYTYTKSFFGAMLKESGINVVKSQYDEGYNFGSLEYVEALRKKYKGIVCPVTAMNARGQKVPDKFCGSSCTACMNKENVLFVQH